MNTNWSHQKLSDLFLVETGTTPSTKEKRYWENGTVNWITPTDLSKLDSRLEIFETERCITEAAVHDYNLTLLPEGSIIVSTRAPVGYVAVVRKKATFNQGCKGLILKDPSKSSAEFYSYFLLAIKQRLQSLSGGSTFKELSKAALMDLAVPIPSFTEQRKVAGILSEFDAAIELNKTKLEKLKRIKASLLNDLITGKVRHPEFV